MKVIIKEPGMETPQVVETPLIPQEVMEQLDQLMQMNPQEMQDPQKLQELRDLLGQPDPSETSNASSGDSAVESAEQHRRKISLSLNQFKDLLDAVKKMEGTLGELPFVEVHAADGTEVTVYL